ncbi:hypothetical protein S40288_00833 [Stachybotrys chartarum IBT 40288]|nr:hypothetical protein S40288_00833 [Stachybotrys chartarum IBT 40288]
MAVLSRPPFVRPVFSALPPKETAHDEPEDISSLYDLIRFNAHTNPNHIFCIQAQAVKDAASDRPFDAVYITYRQLEDAVHRCADWLGRNLESTEQNNDSGRSAPIAIYLESDIGLFIHLVAIQVLDLPVLLISTRMSASNVEHLMSETSARTILVTKRTAPLVAGLIDSSLDIKTAEPYTTFLAAEGDPQSLDSWPRDINGARAQRVERDGNDRSLILHSSGTTGFPKPIHLTKRYLLQYASCHGFAPDEKVDWINLTTLPLYHGFGQLAPCLSLSLGMTCCFPPSSIIPAGQSTLDLLNTFGCRSLMTVPSIVDDLLALDGALDQLADLAFLAVGGGAMKPDQGLQLKSRKVKLLNHYGVTEIGAIAHIFRPNDDYDWRFLRLRTDLNLQLRPVEGSPRFRLVGYPLGWEEPFEVQDELERNGDSSPDDVEVRILGRVDDVIVLKTGEKVQPQHLETVLNADPLIKTGICIGQGSFELAVLVEPAESRQSEAAQDPADFVDHVWNLISATNSSLDSHARVSSKAAIIVKPPGKAIPRTDKGSVSRRQVHEVFAEEIEAAYAVLETELANDSPDSEGLDLDDLTGSILRMTQTVFPNFLGNEKDDFFEHGMDSLQAARLNRLLTSAMRRHDSSKQASLPEIKISPEFIYQNPTVERLSAVVRKRLLPTEDETNGTMEPQDRLHQMDAFAQRFTANLTSDTDARKFMSLKQPQVVLMTGATGNLGTHTLSLLTSMPTISKVICLHRGARSVQSNKDGSKSALERFKASVASNGIHLEDSAWAKIELVDYAEFLRDDQRTYDAQASGSPRDISQSLFLQIAQQVTQIIHLAWPMDFQRTLESFTPHLQMVEALVRLGRVGRSLRPSGAAQPVRLIFSSSIAVVRNYHKRSTAQNWSPVAEELIDDPSASAPIGYPAAKWVCERMLSHIYRSCSDEVEPVVLRIGQLSGPEAPGSGQWKTGEHFPTLVKASKAIGAFPDLKGAMSWIPVDRAAQVMTDILFYPSKPDCFLHLENPMRQPAADILTFLSEELGLLGAARLPFEEWLQKALDVGIGGSLSAFFQDHFRDLALGTIVLDTTKARAISPTLKGSNAVQKELIVRYVRRWKDLGLFE